MDVNFDKGIIRVYEKNLKLDTVLKRLSLLNGEQVYHFLNNRGIQIPRIFNCYALMSVLNQKIKFLHSKSLSKDYFTRLQYYKYFTEQQLFNLFRKICNDEISFQQYRYNFFKLLILNFVGMNINDGEIIYLKNLKKGKMESFEEYFNYISSVSLEVEGSFDGRDIQELKEILPLSASNQDIYDIAGKYGINLPTRLKKKEFLDFIVYYMKKNNEYSDAMALELEAMTMAQLQTYARRTGVPMQPAMGKAELVTYLFYYLDQFLIDTTSFSRVVTSEEFQPLDFTVDFQSINAFQADEAKKVIHYDGEDEDVEEFNQVLLEEDIEDDEVIDEVEENASASEALAEENTPKEENEEAPATKEALEEPQKEEEASNNTPKEEEGSKETFILEEAKEEEEAIIETPKEETYEEPSEEKEPSEEEAKEEALNEESLEPDADEEEGFSVQYFSEEYRKEEEAREEEEATPKEEALESQVEEEPTEEELYAMPTDEEINEMLQSNLEKKAELNEASNADERFNDVRVNENFENEKLLKAAKGKSKKGIIISVVLLLLLAAGICAWLVLKK